MHARSHAGFTLIEVLVALAIISVIASFGLFATIDSYQSTRARTDAGVLDLLLRRARAEALNDSSTGICYKAHSHTLILRHASADTATALASDAVLGGLPDCDTGIFTFGTTVNLTLTEAQRTMRIAINSDGGIDDAL